MPHKPCHSGENGTSLCVRSTIFASVFFLWSWWERLEHRLEMQINQEGSIVRIEHGNATISCNVRSATVMSSIV